MTKQANQPVKEYRAGTIRASVWEKVVQEGGQKRTRHSIQIQKRFCDEQGRWRDTDCFFPTDLPKLELVARKAFEFVSLRDKGIARQDDQ